MFADVARDIAKDLKSATEWQIEVSDDAGRSIYTIKITAGSKELSPNFGDGRAGQAAAVAG